MVCDISVLMERTDRRVDQMVEAGLLQEMIDFHETYNQQRFNENKSVEMYTKSISL